MITQDRKDVLQGYLNFLIVNNGDRESLFRLLGLAAEDDVDGLRIIEFVSRRMADDDVGIDLVYLFAAAPYIDARGFHVLCDAVEKRMKKKYPNAELNVARPAVPTIK